MVSFRHQFVLNLSWLEACFPVSLSNGSQVVCMLRREPRTWAPAFLSAAPVSLANAHACPRIDSVSRRSRSRPEVGWIMPVSPSLMRSSRPLGEAASLEERQGLRYSNRGRADTRVGFGFSCAKLVRLSASVEMDEVDCKRTCVWEQGSVLMRMTVRATTLVTLSRQRHSIVSDMSYPLSHLSGRNGMCSTVFGRISRAWSFWTFF